MIDSNHTARIADFGLTSLLRHSSISISMTPSAWGGSYRWMAPELFDGKSRPSRESDIYALGMVIYEVCQRIPQKICLKGPLSQVFAHEQPFSHICSHAVPVLVLAGERPSRLTNRDILGLSEEVWMLMEKCWNQVPSARPHAADILVLLEAASHDWVSPTSGVIENLSLSWPISQNSPVTESAGTMSETAFGTIGGGGIGSRVARKLLPTSNGEGMTAATTETVEDTFPLAFLTCLRFLWNSSLFSWLL